MPRVCPDCQNDRFVTICDRDLATREWVPFVRIPCEACKTDPEPDDPDDTDLWTDETTG